MTAVPRAAVFLRQRTSADEIERHRSPAITGRTIRRPTQEGLTGAR
jgi:hypothetical protein